MNSARDRTQTARFTRADLIPSPLNGVRPIETKGKLRDRLVYAAKVFNNKKDFLKSLVKPYEKENIAQAKFFLIKELQLPLTSDDNTINQMLLSCIAQLQLDEMQWLCIPEPELRTPMRLVNRIKIRVPSYVSSDELNLLVSYQEKMKQAIQSINTDINHYNQLHDLERKKQLLEQINLKKTAIEVDSPADIVGCCENYSLEILEKFYTSIQRERSKLKQLSDEAALSTRTETSLASQSMMPHMLSERDKISAMLSSMHRGKLQKLAVLLSEESFSQSSLSSLFKPGELGYEAFHHFNHNHTITLLTRGHSKNFKIAPKQSHNDNDGEMVLKLGEQLLMTRRVTERLRNSSFSQHLVSSSAEQQVSFTINGQKRLKTISINDFCPEGNLFSHSKKTRAEKNNLKTIQLAINLFSQMATILLELSRLNIAFPDMKNTNWLVKNGKVLIADTKSFVATDNGRVTEQSIAKDNAERALLLGSKGFVLPEMEIFSRYKQPFSADQMHSGLLGIALFQYLTSCYDERLWRRQDSSTYNDWSVFQLEEGIKLKQLIQSLCVSARTRPSVQEVLDRLNQIKLESENKALIAQLNDYKLNNTDTQLLLAVRQFEREMQSSSLQKVNELNEKLKQIHLSLAGYKDEISQLKATIAANDHTSNQQKRALITAILNKPFIDRGVNASADNNQLVFFDKKQAIMAKLSALLASWRSERNQAIDAFENKYHQTIAQASRTDQLDNVNEELDRSWILCVKNHLLTELASIKNSPVFNPQDAKMSGFAQSFEQKIHAASNTAQLEDINNVLQSSWLDCLMANITSLKRYVHAMLSATQNHYNHPIKSKVMDSFVLIFQQKIDQADNMEELKRLHDTLSSSLDRYLKEHLLKVLDDIQNNHKLSNQDRMMNQFFYEYHQKITQAKNLNELHELEIKLTTIQQQLRKAQPGLKYILDKITQYRDGYHYQGKAKAQLIEGALFSSRIEDRGTIHTRLPVMNALAARRYRLFTRVKPEDSVKSNHLASTYKVFKERFIDIDNESGGTLNGFNR